MIPRDHVLLLALLQFSLGLLGLLIRRSGMVVIVSLAVMLNGVLLAFCARVLGDSTEMQVLGIVWMLVLLALSVIGTGIVFAFHHFRRNVNVDEHDRLRH